MLSCFRGLYAACNLGNAIGEPDWPLFEPAIHRQAYDTFTGRVVNRLGENDELRPHVRHVMTHAIYIEKHLNGGAVTGLRRG